MRRVGLVLPALAAALIVALGPVFAQPTTPAPAAPASPTDSLDRSRFVQVRGAGFTLEGEPFRFVGANAAVMHGRAHRERADTTLTAMAADGLRVARVWALGEQPADAAPWARDFAFRIGPDGWVAESFAHLDTVLEIARARGLRVIVVLANRWADYGGAPRYLSWSGVDVPGPAAAPLGDGLLARFFADATAQRLYRAHVEHIVWRVSAITGRAYRNDPVILGWELVNESDAAPRSREGLLAWTSSMAAAVHALDPVHLVAAGHIGYTSRAQRSLWLALQRLPGIDYADAHAYPMHNAGVRTVAALRDFVDDHAQLAHFVAGKPLVFGEAGFSRTPADRTGAMRATWFRRFLQRCDEDGVDGVLPWIYTPATNDPQEHGVFVDGPLVTQTAPVRAVLADFAARWRSPAPPSTNARLGGSIGETPLWSTMHLVRGPGAGGATPRVTADGLRWSMAPERYASAEAEHVGRWDAFALTHVYVSGTGRFTYALRVTPASALRGAHATAVTVRFRGSSELPGRGEGATAEDGSTVRVTLDGHVLGDFDVPPDDALGRWITLRTDDPAVLAALRRPGVHTLGLAAVDGPRGNGLCLYGGLTGREAPPADVGRLPGRVEVDVDGPR